MQECKKLIRIRGQRHPSNTIPWAILRQVMTPTLTRAAQSSKDNLQDQLEQQRCRWFAGRPVRPYLHHTTTMTLLSCFGTDFRSSHLTHVFRKSPVDNYVWRKDHANRGSRKRSQTACLVLAGASDSVMELWHYIALTP